ncbi:MAG: hypothetical protein KAJ93_08785, partial [Methanosarcinales archaeon]|nr:hypothetical protein [Methanosarcinales archaeon]
MNGRKRTEILKRWINTRVVIDRTGKVLEKQGFWYDGPLALATTPPTMEVTNWAFYSDGTEAGSVIVGAANTNQSLNVDTIYFARFGLEETGNEPSKNEAPQLQYNLNSGGWNNVTDVSSVVRAAATANIADGDDTTQRITSFTFDTTNEGFDEVDGIAGGPTCDLQLTGFEALFSFTIRSADVANNDTIVLRIVDSNNSDAAYDVYNQTDPTVTVVEEESSSSSSQSASVSSSSSSE